MNLIWNNVDLGTNLPYHLICMKILINETTSMTNCSVISTQTKTHQCVRTCMHTKWYIVLFSSSFLLLIDIHYICEPYRNQRCFDCLTMSIHVSLCTVAIVLVQRWILIHTLKKNFTLSNITIAHSQTTSVFGCLPINIRDYDVFSFDKVKHQINI